LKGVYHVSPVQINFSQALPKKEELSPAGFIESKKFGKLRKLNFERKQKNMDEIQLKKK